MILRRLFTRPPGSPAFDPERVRAALPAYAPGVGSDAVAPLHAHYDVPVELAAHADAGFVESRIGRIAVHVLRPEAPRGAVIMVHGLFDHALLWRHQMRWALDRDLAVCALDLPGHGLSDGERAHVEDFADYVDALEAVVDAAAPELPGPRLGLGQSTGGSVLLQVLLDASRGNGDDRMHLDDAVLLAPLVRPVGDRLGRPLVPVLAPMIRALPRVAYGNTGDDAFNRFQRDEDVLQCHALRTSWVRAMGRWSEAFDALPPSDRSPCVVQGDRDNAVAWRGNLKRLRRAFEDPEVVLIPGARHNLMNERPEIRERIEHLLDARLDRLLGD